MAEIYNFQDFVKNVQRENSLTPSLESANDQVFDFNQIDRLVELVKSTNNILESIAQSIVGITAINDNIISQGDEDSVPDILTANPNAAANPEDDNVESPEELLAKNSTLMVNLLKENNDQNKTQISELRKIFDLLNRPLGPGQASAIATQPGTGLGDLGIPPLMPPISPFRRTPGGTVLTTGKTPGRTVPTTGKTPGRPAPTTTPQRRVYRDSRGRFREATRMERLRESLSRGASTIGRGASTIGRGASSVGRAIGGRGLGVLTLGVAAAQIYSGLEDIDATADEKLEIINSELEAGTITPEEADTLKQTVAQEITTEKGGFLGETAARTASATAGATVGAAVGQALIPIPFVGAAIGGLAGGYLADRYFGEEVGGYGRKIGENISGYGNPETNIEPGGPTPLILPQTEYPTIQTIPDNNGSGVRELSDENIGMLQGSVNSSQFNIPIISSNNVVNNRTSYVPRSTSPRNTTSPLDQYFSRIQSFT